MVPSRRIALVRMALVRMALVRMAPGSKWPRNEPSEPWPRVELYGKARVLIIQEQVGPIDEISRTAIVVADSHPSQVRF